MSGYGQFCPVAKAMEILDERWTLLVVRELLLGSRHFNELRRGIEAIPEDDYHRRSYYRRWIRSITDTLLRKGVITEAELRAALDRV